MFAKSAAYANSLREVSPNRLLRWCLLKSPKSAALEFILYILNYKVENGLLASCPCLGVVMVQGQLPERGLPAPWMLLASPEPILVPKPFAALPPRGRRHMLEIKGALNKNPSQEEVVPKYLLTFFGGIFHFRQKLDDQEVPGVYLKTGASKHQCEYARYIEFGDAATGKLQVTRVSGRASWTTCRSTSSTACEDPVAAWLAAQASVRTKRTLSEVRQHGTPIDLHYTTN